MKRRWAGVMAESVTPTDTCDKTKHSIAAIGKPGKAQVGVSGELGGTSDVVGTVMIGFP